MKIRVFLVTVALAAFGWAGVPASTSLMPIDEVKPGMTGVGRTIFEGAEMQDFKVHILGVLKNVQAPQRNLILARLEGGPLATTGVTDSRTGVTGSRVTGVTDSRPPGVDDSRPDAGSPCSEAPFRDP